MIRLSQRLQALANLVPSGMRVCDVGTDHAFLPCYLVMEGISPRAIGVELNRGPYDTAWRTVRAYSLEDKIEIRLGNGLQPLLEGEADVIIIAGMGGAGMVDILEGSPLVVEGALRLILQPMNGAELLRAWLCEKGWLISAEDLVEDDGRIYQVIAVGKGNQNTLSSMELIYGPLLIKQRHPLLLESVKKDRLSLQDILCHLAKSESEDAKDKTFEIKKRIRLIKELEECLSAVRQ